MVMLMNEDSPDKEYLEQVMKVTEAKKILETEQNKLDKITSLKKCDCCGKRHIKVESQKQDDGKQRQRSTYDLMMEFQKKVVEKHIKIV